MSNREQTGGRDRGGPSSGRRERRRAEEEAPSDGQDRDGGLAAAARAVGRAFGLLRWRRGGNLEESSAEPLRKRVAGSARAAARSRAGTAPSGLQAEVHRLEAELDAVYASISRRESSPAGSGAAELGGLIERARELKELLQSRRRALVKLERDAARERLLRTAAPAHPAPAPPSDNRPKKALATAADRKRAAGKAETEEPRRAARRGSDGGDGATRLVLDKLQKGLKAPDAETRRAATLQLSELESSGARELLASAVEDKDERVRATALNALARTGSPASAPLFRRYASHENPHLRLAALRGLARVDDPEANSRLIDALEDDHPLTRRTAATLLGWREAGEAAVALVLALRDEDEGVRAAAAGALAGLRQDRAVLPLIRTLGDPVPAVREAALGSLRALAGDEVDIALDAKQFTEGEIAVLKRWWRGARLERQLVPVPGLPEQPLSAGEKTADLEATGAKPAGARPAPARREPAAAPKAGHAQPAVGAEPARPADAPAAGPAAGRPAPEETNPALDDMLGGAFTAVEAEDQAVEMTAETPDGDEESGDFESPLDGLLSDLGARPAEPKKSR